MVKKYELTPEHRARLPEWRDKWIANAMSTKAMDDEDRRLTTEAVIGMYAAADYPAPKVLFVSSPLVAAFAGVIAANYKGKNIPYDEIIEACSITPEVGEGKDWYVFPAKEIIEWSKGFLKKKPDFSTFSQYWNGGNQYSAWCSYLSFFRHVAKLDIDYSKWQHYETAALHSGPRMMHEKFCIVSDRPEVLIVNDDNQPHNEEGPFCRWRDGVALYAVEGHYIPAWVIEHKERITVEDIKCESNAETRRIMMRYFGEGRYLAETNARVLDADTSPTGIPRCLIADDGGDHWLVATDSSTERAYYMPVPPEAQTCREAHQLICFMDESKMVLES